MESQSALGQLVFLPGYFYLQNQVSQFLFLNHFADQICLQSKSFFEKETDPALFEGLYIAQNIELCRQYMGQYPVISISLKGVDSNSYEGAYKLLVQSICDEIERFQFLIESNELTQIDKKKIF